MTDHAIGLGVGLALVSLAPRAGAQTTPSLELAWSAPEGCPDHDAVVARVERWLTRPLDASAHGALSIAARVTPGPPWHLEMAIVGREGSTTRSLDDASCERLADATALMITLALDPEADDPNVVDVAPVAPVAPRATAAPTTVYPVDTERVRGPVARPPARRSTPAAFTLGAAIAFDSGTLPGFGVGAEARVGLALGRLRLALRGDFWPPYATPAVDTVIHVALGSVGAQACYVPTRGALEFRACGALDVGEMYTVVPGAGSPGALWAATFAEVGLGWRPVQWLSLRLELGPGLTLARPRFVDAGATTQALFEPSFVVGRGAFAAEFTL